jgi:ABC-type dipeptide/oligopeptide/nickel transport system permease component
MAQKQIQLEIFDLGQKVKKGYSQDRAEVEKLAQAKFPAQLCVKIAAFLIMIVVSFALGVEHGKSIARINGSVKNIAENKITPFIKANPAKKQNTQQQTITNENIAKEKINQNPITSDEYTVQVATYKKDSSYVDKGVSKLKQQGYVAVLIPSDEWMQLCAGKFSSKKIANEHKKKLEQTYKGCLVRKI